MKDTLFPEVTEKSVPYYKHNFAEAIANLDSLIPACKSAYCKLFDAAFEPWSDYDTGFEEKRIYRTNDSGLTLDFLRGFVDFFSGFEEALNVIDTIINEYWEEDELPEEVATLKSIFENYKRTYFLFFDSISSLFQDLEEVASYDASEEACRIIANDYGMEAVDEDLDYYADKAMNEAAAEYEDIIRNAEDTVNEALSALMEMSRFFEQLRDKLFEMLEVNSKIDNTNVRRTF